MTDSPDGRTLRDMVLDECGFIDGAEVEAHGSYDNDLAQERADVIMRFIEQARRHSYPESLLPTAEAPSLADQPYDAHPHFTERDQYPDDEPPTPWSPSVGDRVDSTRCGFRGGVVRQRRDYATEWLVRWSDGETTWEEERHLRPAPEEA